MPRTTLAWVCVALVSLAAAAPAWGMGNPNVAALQVGLRLRGLYAGPIDGLPGSGTREAVQSFQRRAGLTVDGVAGERTRRALGRFGRHRLGSRPLAHGRRGWDVAALQFLLAWHGFPSGVLDGTFGGHVDAALRRFQRWARVAPDGVAGPATLAALRARLPRSPLALAWPLALPVGDGFGPRDDRFHPGIDIPASPGTPVAAARSGHVVFAGFDSGGYGRLVVIAHGRGVRTMYAHLSRVLVAIGDRVSRGARIGLVGSTGHATGPHLHFEVRVRDAAVDPLVALP